MSRALPDAAYAAALASLPGIGPATLHGLLCDHPPGVAWNRVLRGEISRPARRPRSAGPGALLPLEQPAIQWQQTLDEPGQAGADPPGSERVSRAGPPWAAIAQRYDVAGAWERISALGIGVTWPGERNYPPPLEHDPQPPGVLFWRGRTGCLDSPCVAIVGTRRCSPDGRRVAFELGRDLAAAGVCVVSGLALGVDGAAHRGALAGAGGSAPGTSRSGAGPGPAGGTTVGVAASGVDVPYPRQHAELWQSVVAAGAVLSETPPGHPAQAWRFPSRNRIIAGLVRMVVVVESFRAGGSLLTADAALARGVDVRAVPGPVHSPASAGSNRLLLDGAAPVCDAGDVLDALSLSGSSKWSSGSGCSRPAPRASQPPQGDPESAELPPLSAPERVVLDAVGWAPTGLGRISERCGQPLGAVALAISELQSRGLIEGDGTWWVRTGGR